MAVAEGDDISALLRALTKNCQHWPRFAGKHGYGLRPRVLAAPGEFGVRIDAHVRVPSCGLLSRVLSVLSAVSLLAHIALLLCQVLCVALGIWCLPCRRRAVLAPMTGGLRWSGASLISSGDEGRVLGFPGHRQAEGLLAEGRRNRSGAFCGRRPAAVGGRAAARLLLRL